MKLSDEALVEGCVAGKPAAQRAFYERFAGKMMQVCRRYCPDEMEAEDLLHQCLLKILGKMQQFRGGNLEGWVRQICVRQAINGYHIRKRRKIDYVEDMSEAGFEEVHPNALSAMSLQDLHRLVESLPDGARLVFSLFAIEGYEHTEIAEMLSISVGTSKSQLSRARKLLQERLIAAERS